MAGTALLLFLLVGAILTHRYVVLLPDRSDQELSFGVITGAASAVITIAALLRFRPKLRHGLAVGVPVLGFCALLLGFMLGIALATEFYNLCDFRQRPLTGFNGYVRVSSFYKSHGKGTHYHLALADFGPDLDLYYDDYRWNAGDRERLAVSGKCIHTRLERSGNALRMIQPEHVRALPCPARPVVAF